MSSGLARCMRKPAGTLALSLVDAPGRDGSDRQGQARAATSRMRSYTTLAAHREIAEEQHVRHRSLELRERFRCGGDGRDLGALVFEHRLKGFAKAES